MIHIQKPYFIPSWVYLLVKSQHFLNHSFVSIISDGYKDVTDNILRIRIWILSRSQNMVKATIKIELTDEESFLLSFNSRRFNIVEMHCETQTGHFVSMKAFSAYPAYSGMQTHRVAVRLKNYDTHTKSHFVPSWVSFG